MYRSFVHFTLLVLEIYGVTIDNTIGITVLITYQHLTKLIQMRFICHEYIHKKINYFYSFYFKKYD